MDPIAQRVVAVGIVGIILTVTRRYKNSDSTAGAGVAGWTIVAIIFLTTD